MVAGVAEVIRVQPQEEEALTNLSGLGEPGQRETTRAGLEHDYYLVKKQVGQAILWGWAIIALVMLMALGFWVRSDWRGCWQWVRAEWPWLTPPFVLWAVFPFGLGVYKMLGMVSDSSWPAPREAIPADQAMPKPEWPWKRDWEYEDEEPAPPQRTVRVEVITNGGKTRQYADLPDLRQLPAFARRVTSGKSFSHREAKACGIQRPQFEDLARTFRDKGWARWRNPANHKEGTELLVVGCHVLKDLATPSPTLLEVV